MSNESVEHLDWREEAKRIRESALALFKAGLSIFPLTHPAAVPGESEAGKRPTAKWSVYQTRRATRSEINAWFGDVKGKSELRNIGIALGPISGCIVIDVDAPGAMGPLRDDGYPVAGKWVKTAKGEHWYYGWDDEHPIGNRAKITVGGARLSVDIRGQGGYVVGPGSRHASGHVYELFDEGGDWSDLEKLPAELAQKIEAPTKFVVTERTPEVEDATRAHAIIDLCASSDTKSFIRKGAKEGERNNRIFRAARDLNGLGITLQLAESLLLKSVSLGPGDDIESFQKTVRSAYSSPAIPSCAYLMTKTTQVVAMQEEAVVAARTIAEPEPVKPEPTPPAEQTKTIAELRKEAGHDQVFSNVESVEVTVKDAEGKEKDVIVDLWRSPADIVKQVKEIGFGYPKLLNNALFSIERYKPTEFLSTDNFMYLSGSDVSAKTDKLFGWLHVRCPNGMLWKQGAVRAGRTDKTMRTVLTKSELPMAIASLTKTSYRDVSAVPTWPVQPNCFYLYPKMPEPSPGFECFFRYLDLFNAETPQDRTLIAAMILTTFWGGKPGHRPFFIITSDHGVGVGKTKTAFAAAAPAGGYIALDLRQTDHIKFVEPILTPTGILRRVAIADNFKGKLDHPELEALVTSDKISGRINYIGPVERANTITMMLTLNDARLSTDMASRAIPIKIGRKMHNTDFDAQVRDYLEEKRVQLVADCIGLLQSKSVCEIDQEGTDRWQVWQRAVLTKIPRASSAMEMVAHRRIDVNADAAEALDIEMTIMDICYKRQEHRRFMEKGEYKFETVVLYTYMKEEHLLPDDHMTQQRFGAWLSGKRSHLPALKKNPSKGTRSSWIFEVGKERAAELIEQTLSRHENNLLQRNDEENER